MRIKTKTKESAVALNSLGSIFETNLKILESEPELLSVTNLSCGMPV